MSGGPWCRGGAISPDVGAGETKTRRSLHYSLGPRTLLSWFVPRNSITICASLER